MKNNVHYSKLTPISFLERSTYVYPNKPAIKYGDRSYTYQEFSDRVNKLAGALKSQGIERGEKVGFLVPNIPEMLEGHFAPLKIGAVLVAINIRLSGREIAYILNHSEAKILVFDSEYGDIIEKIKPELKNIKCFVQIVDTEPENKNIESIEYEKFLQTSPDGEHSIPLESEEDPVTINYTSGTTGMPKGVLYHSRGAYISALGNVLESGMSSKTNYLWTLPMFHCNGWCFPWTIAALAGKNICIRKVNSKSIFKLIKKHKVSHLCGTTVIINLLIKEGIKLKNKIEFMTGAAPPPSTVLKKIDDLGFNITHTYGLTEVYGPAVICEWQNDWGKLNKNKIAELKSYQGVRYPGISEINVFNRKTKKEVKHDGKELGEVLMRGNTVMMGYHKDILATNKAFSKGWFHTGDIAVIHKNGYIQLKDRSKDIIISGGENISSIEIENVLFKHKDIIDAAVVAKKDEKWGEVPCAFVTLKKNSTLKANEIIQFCRNNMASYKIPKNIIFGKIDKTPTGKTQKYLLRRKVNLID